MQNIENNSKIAYLEINTPFLVSLAELATLSKHNLCFIKSQELICDPHTPYRNKQHPYKSQTSTDQLSFSAQRSEVNPESLSGAVCESVVV